jgi:MFS family permease
MTGSQTLPIAGDKTTRPSPRAWLFVAAAMFTIGWGGNQFTPLLIVYRQRDGYSEVAVNVFLGAYVLGLIPGLLITSALSDRFGRRRVMIGGLYASIAGSAVLAAGQTLGGADIFTGRFLTGLAVGIAMAVGTAWVNELSTSPWAPGTGAGTGARRSSISLTLGLGVGPGAAGVLAQWAPWPLVLPFLVQIGLAGPALVLLWRYGVETRFDSGALDLRRRLRVPSVAHGRFPWIVLPMAPWIFGSAGVAYAIIPQLVQRRVGQWGLIFATALTVATLGAGVLVQPIARRLDARSSARAVVVAMILMTLGLVAAAVTAQTRAPWLAAPVALLLGAAYGIAVVSGLLEVQRIAGDDDRAGLTGVYFALAYVGFLLPAGLAQLSHWFSYPVMLGAVALVALGCTITVGVGSTRHLPQR